MGHSDDDLLTRRELEIARHYAAGQSYKAIAARVNRSPSTIRNHLTSVYRKLGVTSKVELHQKLFRNEAEAGARPSGRAVNEGGREKSDPARAEARGNDWLIVEIQPPEILPEASDTTPLELGLVKDIATELDRFSSIAVRHFPADGGAGRAPPEFVLECSVRNDGDQLRISAQLHSTILQRQVWSDRFDQAARGNRAIENLIVRQIASRISSAAEMTEIERGRGIIATRLTPYEKALKSRAFVYDAARLASRALLDQAIETSAEALADDPRSTHALWTACLARLYQHMYHWGNDPDACLEEAGNLVERLLHIDWNNARAFLLRAWVYFYMQRYPLALADHYKALELNPNLAANFFAMSWTEAVAGKLDDARQHALLGLELNPRDNDIWIGEGYAALALTSYLNGDFEECVRWGHLAYQRQPVLQLVMAAGHRGLGDLAAARHHADILEEIAPVWFRQVLEGTANICNLTEHSHALRDGLRHAVGYG